MNDAARTPMAGYDSLAPESVPSVHAPDPPASLQRFPRAFYAAVRRTAELIGCNKPTTRWWTASQHVARCRAKRLAAPHRFLPDPRLLQLRRVRPARSWSVCRPLAQSVRGAIADIVREIKKRTLEVAGDAQRREEVLGVGDHRRNREWLQTMQKILAETGLRSVENPPLPPRLRVWEP